MKKINVVLVLLLLVSNVLFAQWKIDEDFENGGLPNTWTVHDIDMDGLEWWDDEDNPHSGTTAVGLYSMNPSNDWLITPQVTIDDGDVFSFWLSSYYGADDEDFNIKISTTSSDVDDFVDFNPSIYITQSSSDYINYSYDLSAYSGQTVYLAIQCVSDNHEGGSAGYVTVDDLKVGQESTVNSSIEIGNETEVDIHLPMAPYWKYSYSQVIYHKDEINVENKRINKISYHYNGESSWNDHAVIYMGHTSLNNYNETEWIPVSELTEVYNSDFTVNEERWVEFTLSEPFTYNNTDNLVIAFNDNSSASGAHSSEDDFYCTHTDAVRGLIYHNDYSSVNIENPTTAIKVSSLANIQISFEDIPSDPVAGINTESVNFEQVLLGQSSEENVTITNMGSEDLVIFGIEITSNPNNEFSFSPVFSESITLAMGESHDISLTFNPATEGNISAELHISNNSEVQLNIPLSGNGINGTITQFPYTEGFEDDSRFSLGWINQDGNWNIGKESHTGTRCARVSYEHNSGDAILIAPPVNLPENSQISFWWKDDDISLSKVVGHDTTFFEISTNNGTSWEIMDTLSANDHHSEYINVIHDLSAFAGDGVLLRWRDVSDNSYSAYGTGLDDILIEVSNLNIAAPTFNPIAGTYNETQNVSILCDTEGASIYYTLDGSEPSNESAIFSTSIEIIETTTIKAIACKEDFNSSDVISSEYIIEESISYTLPFTENFTNPEVLPTGWTTWNGDPWDACYNGTQGHDDGAAYCLWETGWLISPAITVPEEEMLKLSFYQSMFGTSDYVKHGIYYSTTGGLNENEWIAINDDLGEPCGSWELMDNNFISEYSGTQIYVAFKYTADENGGVGWNIDDVALNVVDNTPINVYPYIQDFDAVSVPALPEKWHAIINTSSNTGIVQTKLGHAHSDPNSVMMKNANDINGDFILVSPKFDDLSGKEVSIWADGNSSSTVSLIVGTLSDFNDASTFSQIESIDLAGNYQQYTVSLADYSGSDKYIAFKHGVNSSYKRIYLDDFMIKEVQEEIVLVPPFIETFAADNEFPEGWKSFSGLLTENSTLVSDWTKWILQNYANDGSDNIGVETTYFNSNGAWLVSPSIDLSNQENYQLEFDLALTEFQSNTTGIMEEDDKLKVVISTDNGATWVDAEENILQEWNNTSTLTNNQHITISLEDFTGLVKIAFYAESTVLSNDAEVFVDNIAVNIASSSFNPPTDLIATVSNNNDVTLSWSTPEYVENITGYNIYRNTSKINTSIINEISYEDLNLADGTYDYYVTAVYNNSEESENSNHEIISIESQELFPPENLSYTLENENDVVLNWDAPNNGSCVNIEPCDDIYSNVNGTQNENQLWIANYPAAGHTERAMLKFDLSSINDTYVSNSTLNLYQFFRAPDNSPAVVKVFA
ncbi:MAG: choice-of-anchor J domain-containing protein, partial [Bacteroidota bacterium]|nr:choice-of-anchor J domain-containing protein [Bacteroidota bacterium]